MISKSLQLLRRVNVKVSAHADGHGDSANLQGLVNNFLEDAEGRLPKNAQVKAYSPCISFEPRLGWILHFSAFLNQKIRCQQKTEIGC